MQELRTFYPLLSSLFCYSTPWLLLVTSAETRKRVLGGYVNPTFYSEMHLRKIGPRVIAGSPTPSSSSWRYDFWLWWRKRVFGKLVHSLTPSVYGKCQCWSEERLTYTLLSISNEPRTFSVVSTRCSPVDWDSASRPPQWSSPLSRPLRPPSIDWFPLGTEFRSIMMLILNKCIFQLDWQCTPETPLILVTYFFVPHLSCKSCC